MSLKEISEQVRNLSLLIWTLFGLSTIFFLIQHYFIVSWDFSAYVLNAKYIFSNGSYFELPRPPLAPFIIGLFLWLGKLSEYIFIIIVSSLLLFSSISLSDSIFFNSSSKKKIDRNFVRFLFYFFTLSIFCLEWGMKIGTEILCLSLLELVIAQTIKGKNPGFYLGLAFLTRYPLMIFIPLLLFTKSLNKGIKNILFFIITLTPWFIYNYIQFGNPLASILDSYALNVHFREGITTPFHILDLLDISSIFTITSIIGLVCLIFHLKKKGLSKETFTPIIIVFVTTLTIYSYINIPIKEIRYLFNLIIPISYLSTFSIVYLIKKPSSKVIRLISILCLAIFILNFTVLSGSVVKDYNYSNKFKAAGLIISEKGIENCAIFSPHWVPVAYFTQNVYPLSQSISEKIASNSLVLIFPEDETRDNNISRLELENNSRLYNSTDFIIFGNKDINSYSCTKRYTYDKPNYQENHCNLIDKYKIIKKICLLF